jgi:hypothetical protein
MKQKASEKAIAIHSKHYYCYNDQIVSDGIRKNIRVPRPLPSIFVNDCDSFGMVGGRAPTMVGSMDLSMQQWRKA